MKHTVVVVVGPTASGKTALAIEIAKRYNGEVISADSRQVYEGLDIGTGKVTKEEMSGVPHHLIDVANPEDVFSAEDFVRLGREAIENIVERNKLPIIAGGTGFYIDALLGTISLPKVPTDEGFRFEVSGLSLEELNNKLKEIDPERAETIDTHNRIRIVRALEIARALGSVPRGVTESLYNTFFIGITIPLPELKEKIKTRLSARMNAGMLEEAKKLHREGLSYERMEALGLEYRYLARYLQGTLSYEDMLKELEKEIMRYAKRQMTWFKKNQSIHWLQAEQAGEALREVERFLKR